MSTTVKVNGTSFAVPARGDTDWDVNLRVYLQGITALVATVFQFCASTFPSSTAYFLAPGYATASVTEILVPVPQAGILRNLRVVCTNTTSGPCTITVRNGGALTALTCTLGSGATQASDLTHSVTATAGSYVSIYVNCTGMATTPVNLAVSLSLSAL